MGAARKPVIAVVGGAVLLIGIALIVLPGPAFLVIPLGLGILGTEFLWAKRWLEKARSMMPRRRKPTSLPPASPVARVEDAAPPVKAKLHRAA